MKMIEAFVLIPIALLIGIGTFTNLWRSFHEQQKVIRLAHEARQKLTRYDDETKNSAHAAKDKSFVVLKR